MSDLRFVDTPFGDEVSQRLIAGVQQEYVIRYGSPDETPVDPAEFEAPDGVFVVAFLDDEPIGCAGLRRTDESDGPADIELKRMFVRAEFRGRGFARVLLDHIEQRAREFGSSRLILETGTVQPEAIGLYESAGYQPIPSFGYYAREPLNRCFAKPL